MTDADVKTIKKAITDILNSHHIFHRVITRSMKIIGDLDPTIFKNDVIKEKLDGRQNGPPERQPKRQPE